MIKLISFLIIFLIIFLLFCLYCFYTISDDLFSSIIPGWRTTIFPSNFFISFIILVNFIAPFLLYLIISKYAQGIKISILIGHMMLSTIIISMLKYPTVFINDSVYGINQSAIESKITPIKITVLTFIIEHVTFGIYLIRILKK